MPSESSHEHGRPPLSSVAALLVALLLFLRLRNDRLREDVRRCTHDAAAVAEAISRGAILILTFTIL